MVEVVGDIVMPSELVVPQFVTAKPLSGQLFMSGAKLTFYNGTTHVEVA